MWHEPSLLTKTIYILWEINFFYFIFLIIARLFKASSNFLYNKKRSLHYINYACLLLMVIVNTIEFIFLNPYVPAHIFAEDTKKDFLQFMVLNLFVSIIPSINYFLIKKFKKK
jgi:hypothetical protein